MDHHCLHHSATTHDVAAAIIPVVVDESLEKELDARPPPQPEIESMAVISTGTCHQLRVDSRLIWPGVKCGSADLRILNV